MDATCNSVPLKLAEVASVDAAKDVGELQEES